MDYFDTGFIIASGLVVLGICGSGGFSIIAAARIDLVHASITSGVMTLVR